MMKINVENLRGALKKLKGFSGETVVMEFMTRAAGDGDARYLKLDASNGTAQASVLTVYEGDNAEAKKYIVSSSIMEAVDSIAAFGNEIIIEEMEGSLKLECGEAVVPIGFLKDALTIKMSNLKNVEKLGIKLKSDAFADLVVHGGFATGDSTIQVPIFSGTVIFSPYVEKEKLFLRALSCCGSFIATANTEVETADTNTFYKFAGIAPEGSEEKVPQKNVAVNYASLSALVKRLTGEYVDVVITDKQVIIRDNADAYLFTVIEGAVPERIVETVVNNVAKSFEYTLDRDTLKNALAVICLTGEKIARLNFSGESLVVEDTKHTSRVCVPLGAVKESKAECDLAAGFLKNIASTMPAELTVYGPEGGKGVYFEGKDSKAYLLPVRTA